MQADVTGAIGASLNLTALLYEKNVNCEERLLTISEI